MGSLACADPEPAKLEPFEDTGGSELFVVVPKVEASGGLPTFNERIVSTAGNGSGSYSDYTECAELAEVAGAYLCVATRPRTMVAMWFRASTFIEGNRDGEPGHILSIDSDEYNAGDEWPLGMDLRGEDLMTFWAAAEQACADDSTMCGDELERRAFEELVLPLHERGEPFVVITYTVLSASDWCSVASHEVLLAQYFLIDEYRDAVDTFWANDVSPEDQAQLLAYLTARRYDVSNEFLVRNEFQAYILQHSALAYTTGPLALRYAEALRETLTIAGTPPLDVCE